MPHAYDWDSDIWLVREKWPRRRQDGAATGFLPYAVIKPERLWMDPRFGNEMVVDGFRMCLANGVTVSNRMTSTIATHPPYRLTAEQFGMLLLQSYALHEKHERLARLAAMAQRSAGRSKVLAELERRPLVVGRRLRGVRACLAPGPFFHRKGWDAAFHLGAFYDDDQAWIIKVKRPDAVSSLRSATVLNGLRITMDGVEEEEAPEWAKEMAGRISHDHFIAPSCLDAAISTVRMELVNVQKRRPIPTVHDQEDRVASRRALAGELGRRAGMASSRRILGWDLTRLGAQIVDAEFLGADPAPDLGI